MRPSMRSVLLFLFIAGFCLCTVQAATPGPTGIASLTVTDASQGAVGQATVPTVAGLTADTPAATVSRTSTQTPRATPSPTVRTTTPQPPVTGTAGATATTRASASPPMTAVPDQTVDMNPTSSLPASLPNATVYGQVVPDGSRTPDIDPGMTPYAGATELLTEAPTPTLEAPGNGTNTVPTRTDAPEALPPVTAAVTPSSTYELPPGAYGTERTPSGVGSQDTPETQAPLPATLARESAGSTFLPRWASYLLFIILGISGVAGIALVGSYVRSRSVNGAAVAPATSRAAPPRVRGPGLVRPEATGFSMEQQILVDLIAGFDPRSMRVERLGRHLLRLEQSGQGDAKGAHARLGGLLALSAVPSMPIPAPAAAWAREHGFRILAVDGSGMALVMPDLPSGRSSALGVLPVSGMAAGASPVPMPVPPVPAAGPDRAGA